MYHGFRNFFNELSRRGVLKAGTLYLAAAWVLIQVGDTALLSIGLPQWVFNLMVWLTGIAFPFFLAFTWRYDVTLDGIRRTRRAPDVAVEELTLSTGDYLALACMALIVGGVAWYLAGLLKQQQFEVVEPAAPVIVAAENSIAVLPFENLGGDNENYLGQGLAEDILHRLVSIPDLQVASRTASFELDRSNLSMAEIGARLNASKVLEGSVRRAGDEVRIVAQLIDARTGYHLWSSRYDRRIEDLFRIYDEISAAVASELQLTLAPGTRLITPPPTVDMEAYDFFLQARSILQRASHPDNFANAQRFFARAVEIDPEFAEAWAGQCSAFLQWHAFERSADKIEAAEQSCRRALELDPELAESNVALGDLFRTVGANDQALVEYQQALEIDPDLAAAWRGIGMTLGTLGADAEAENALLKAVELDPDDLSSLHMLGSFYMDRGRVEEAMPFFERMANHPRAGASTYNTVGWARAMLGDFEGAAAAFRQVVALDPTSAAYSNVGVMYYVHGNFEDAEVMLREAISLDPENPINWANLGDALREQPDAQAESLEAYRKGAELSEAQLAINASDPYMLTNLAHCLSRLGDDARAQELIDRVLALTPDDPYAHYYAALVHLEAGRQARALTSVEQSVALNFPVNQLRNDPQFDALRDNPDFQALLARSEQSANND